MSFEIFQEGGPLNIKRTGHEQYSLSVSLPEDRDGRTARECLDQGCSPGYFKIKFGTGLKGPQATAYCPYCRNAAEPSDFHTKEQVRYAKDLAMREAKIGAERAVREALGFGSGGKRRLVDGLIKIDMEMKSDPPEHVWQPYEDILQRDLVCPHCTLDHSVYGFAIWCPDCGKDIFTTHIRGEIRVIEAIVGDVDRRKNELGARVAARDLENALEDLVSIFEATLKIEIRRYRKNKGDSEDAIDATMKKIGSRLQSVSSAVTIVPESCAGVSLFPTGSNDEVKLDRVFQKRHPITHNLSAGQHQPHLIAAGRHGHQWPVQQRHHAGIAAATGGGQRQVLSGADQFGWRQNMGGFDRFPESEPDRDRQPDTGHDVSRAGAGHRRQHRRQ
jgi:ribosomal protein L44E